MTRKIFHVVLLTGILFSLILLVALPPQIVVNFDANGVPRDSGSKWALIPFLLLFQLVIFLFTHFSPFFINHACRAEVWKNNHMPLCAMFLPKGIHDERKMRKFRETVWGLFCVAGIASVLFLIAMQWYVAANNKILPALFPQTTGEGVLLCCVAVFFIIVPITMALAIWEFFKAT